MSLTQGKKIDISYFDPFDLFESVKSEFSQILPLENIHWKSSNGVTRTITSLPISLDVEDQSKQGPNITSIPFIRTIIVSCNSVEEYRSKVRPLLREWLPEIQRHETISNGNKGISLTFTSTPIIFFYSNSTVVDSNLFKTVTIMEKFNKDFPEIEALELKSVYKSLKEKEEFWNRISQKLKSHFLEIFQQRLDYLNGKLTEYMKLTGESKQDAKDMLFIKEKLFDLYFKANLLEEGSNELKEIKIDVSGTIDEGISKGQLEIPFTFDIPEDDSILIADSEENKLTTYYLLKYFFIRDFFFLALEVNINTRILKLYKLTKQFLINIEAQFHDNENLLVFKYIFLTLVIKYVEEIKISDVSLLSEVKAELLLMKRDCWIKGVLEITEYVLPNKKIDNLNKRVTYKFDVGEETYKDEDTFYENFIKFNTELLALYKNCEGKRQRIIDIISLEIGMVYHQRKDYQNAVSLLISCYEFYVESNWNVIGLHILKVFIDSLENCPKLENIELDGSSVNVSTILCNSYLNLIKLSSNLQDKELYWDKFLKLKKGNEMDDITYSLNGFFDINIEHTVSLQQVNTYNINLQIGNIGFPEDVQAKFIKLTLRECNRQESKVEFLLENVELKRGSYEYTLSTKNIIFGKFEINSLEIMIHDTIFLQEFGLNTENIDEDINSSEPINGNAPIVEIFELYISDNMFISLEQAKILELGENSLEVKIDNFNKIKNPKLTLEMLNSSISRFFSFKNNEVVHTKNIDNITEECFRIPYYLEEQITSFELELELSFERKDVEGTFSERKTIQIECFLPVSVSVEDIFKKDLFFFKFLLSSSLREVPIILHSSKLTIKESDRKNMYDIIGDFEPEAAVVLLPSMEETCLNCYRLRAKDNFNTSDIFNLHVHYNTLKEQVDCLVTDSILVEGDVEFYKKYYQWRIFWSSNILSQLRYDYELFNKSKIIRIDNGLNIVKGLNKIICKKISSDPAVKSKMLNCLENLTRGVPINELDISEYTQNLTPRELIVPVTLPEFEQFYRVTFNKIEPINEKISTDLGTPQQFDIVIENMSNNWGRPSTAEITDHILEIQSNNDWLLQGKRRFMIPKDKYKFSVTLIPLKTGYITLPHVEITNLQGEASRVDQANQYESILVL
ncbi:similar to Saccharomyces cerevisiae YMR218C TRS130 One of 10 subunits of the transport protein particle (TRAPP) complex of the cis-Golgi which mediates vesicle docking and fusion [Maudiozyma saulgeensis]|uniref:Similar to Saccharomyces cerevisiae YMR218C TRS130 One of 10 subunits of the transport protein particle (TRAPP) complex of the cis-Golgi which mediates vesicle docking and fusion n=1 Tax=Maudiozyma saulgeensis TaxID=1789683 RepID=A0A1X7R915_9SACH|nr:similar to Saccharomyces cerevisiae YMR218C TRS130 One of 10 subunits of the transport protein particle (TRAPP) complex of the cis-Golgi which mediates vesicle docking and fusion [Kazachstania saulgeensis]